MGWRRGNAELGYRRFFDITSLAAIRVEDPAVFDDAHREVLRWVGAGEVTGLRVDHPDGLTDPGGYAGRLREAAPDAWIVVEKILHPGEDLPTSWPVEGTKAEKRAERAVSYWLLLGGVAGLALILVFLFWPWEYKPFESEGERIYTLATPLYGLTFGLSILAIGIGAVLYQKKFIPEEISIQDRHDGASPEVARRTLVAQVAKAGEDSSIGRRSLILTSAGAAAGIFGLGFGIATIGPLVRDPWKGGPEAALERRRLLSRAALLWEAVWPRLWPALGLLGLFLVLALLELPQALPGGWHTLLLAAVAGGLGFLLWRGFRGFRPPGDAAAERRLERQSGLRHRPLQALADRPAAAASNDDPAAQALWKAHQDRAAAQIAWWLSLGVITATASAPSRRAFSPASSAGQSP